MRYFFLVYALIIVLVVSFFGFRGQTFSGTPIQIFPDMDNQDKVKSQSQTDFFTDGLGSRKPVAGSVPRGYESGSSSFVFGHEASYNYGNNTNYHQTGQIKGNYGSGMPKALGLNEATTPGFLRHGQERYNVSCMPCHGESGNGKGTVAVRGIPTVPSLLTFAESEYPDGQMYETITKGKGLMSGYGYNIPVNDRWAIIAYVRALQNAKETTSE